MAPEGASAIPFPRTHHPLRSPRPRAGSGLEDALLLLQPRVRQLPARNRILPPGDRRFHRCRHRHQHLQRCAEPIALRIDNAGTVRWVWKYVADVGHPTTARITSIVPLEAPDRYLISAVSSDDDAWLFQIDGASGTITDTRLISSTHIRRLRMT